MVRAGEAGGVLDQILARLADYMKKSLRLRQKIVGALVYPAAVVTIAGGILTFILIFIIPRVDTLVGALMSLLEPILIIGMGGAVGFIVIALFMPLIAIMDKLNGR